MCRLTTSVCFWCEEEESYVVPCEDRIEDSPLITLFVPSPCINKNSFIISFHNKCAKNGTFANMSLEGINARYSNRVPTLVSKMAVCDDVVIIPGKHSNVIVGPNPRWDGEKHWNPTGNETSISDMNLK
jgi:hypothetical protein